MSSQCTQCGQPLSSAFVAGLAVEPASCPACGTTLTAADFGDELGQAAAPEGPDEEPAGAAELRRQPATDGPDADADADGDGDAAAAVPTEDVVQAGDRGTADPSVRPPDLDPDEVRTQDALDVLAGWDDDAAATNDPVAGAVTPPPDAAVVAGAALFGMAVGAVATRRRVLGLLVGGLVGVVAGAAARQVWRLPA